MRHSPSREAHSSSHTQGIPHILWDPIFYYLVHNSQPSVPILSRINSGQTLIFYWRFVLILSSHLHLDIQSGLFPLGFPTRSCTHLFFLPWVPHILPILHVEFYYSNNLITLYQIKQFFSVKYVKSTAFRDDTKRHICSQL